MNILLSVIVWFTCIFFMVITFPLNLIIWLFAFPFDKKRAVIHWILVYQGILLTSLIPIWRLRIEGKNKLLKDTTYIIISNHQSILDILFINCLRMRFKWVSKIENSKVPFIGWYLKMAGYITVDRGNSESKEEMLEKSYNCLVNGTSIMIFPEGTRSVDGQPGLFKRGAFQLAISANVPILPVVIDGTGEILPKHGFLFKGGHQIKIKIFDPLFPQFFETKNPDDLALRFNSFYTNALVEMRDGE
jgi:1-acyl-sn-glycerol-3-phosphate acyltransferase